MEHGSCTVCGRPATRTDLPRLWTHDGEPCGDPTAAFLPSAPVKAWPPVLETKRRW